MSKFVQFSGVLLIMAAGLTAKAVECDDINTIQDQVCRSVASSGSVQAEKTRGTGDLKSLEQLQREFVDLRFGMFMHYGIRTYTRGGWGKANQDLTKFDLKGKRTDCDQWADVAVSANMKFGLLTTKHHDGFCLWDSKYTTFDVASTPYKHDVVKEYVDAFRKKGLKIGIYYSLWDATQGIDANNVTAADMEYIKGQITELLSNYGKIDIFVIDGWFWKTGHRIFPYNELRAFIRKLQPDCLFSEHTHLQALYHVDIPYFEGPFGSFPEEGNILPSALGKLIVKGSGWFWSTKATTGKCASVEDIVNKHLNLLEPRYCNLTLNCPPNNQGRMGDNVVERLKEIGEAWQPNLDRPPLPSQGKQMIYPVITASATATSGNVENAIDASQYACDYKHWVADPGYPQSITLDLGAVYSGLELLGVVPNANCKPWPETSLKEGNVTEYKLSLSTDGKTFKEVASGKWEADAKMKFLEFPVATARYAKFDIIKANGESAIIAEMELGAYSAQPVRKGGNVASGLSDTSSNRSAGDLNFYISDIRSQWKGTTLVLSVALVNKMLTPITAGELCFALNGSSAVLEPSTQKLEEIGPGETATISVTLQIKEAEPQAYSMKCSLKQGEKVIYEIDKNIPAPKKKRRK